MRDIQNQSPTSLLPAAAILNRTGRPSPSLRAFNLQAPNLSWAKVVLVPLVGLFIVAVTPNRLDAEPAGRVVPQAKPEPTRLALLVGISKYQQVNTNAWRPLKASRDVAELKRVLMTPRYKFRAEDILVLEDREATQEKIQKSFREHLIAKAVPGSIVVFHFSGHGQQVPDQDGDELDGLDETLVPYDAIDQRASAGAKVNIRDDDIAVWLRELQTRMRSPSGKVEGSINVFLDSCFSGTATRGRLVERGRGWDVDLDGPRPPIISGSAVSTRGNPGSLLDSEGEYIALSAAQSNQTALEVGDMGLFSRALVATLERATDQTTYRDILGEVSAEVLAEVRNQLPQLEGNPELRLFSGVVQPIPSYVRVSDFKDDRLTLRVGSLHLVTLGSVYEIHSGGAAPLSKSTLLGEAEVVTVLPTTSQLRLLPGFQRGSPAVSLLAARAIERAHNYASRPLRILLTGIDRSSEVGAAVGKLTMGLLVSAAPQNYDVEIRRERDKLELLHPEDHCPFVTLAAQPSDVAVSRIQQVLSSEWRWRQLLELRQSNPTLQVRLRLVPVAVTLEQTGHISRPPILRGDITASQQLSLVDGDFFMLELSNLTHTDVWVTVLELENTGAIEVKFPLPRFAGDGRIRAGDTRLVPLPYVFRVEPPFGPSVFKVIATAEKVDLGLLTTAAYQTGQQPKLQSGDRDTSRAVAPLLTSMKRQFHPLARLLAESALGQRSLTSTATELGAFSVTDAVLLLRQRTVANQRNLANCDGR